MLGKRVKVIVDMKYDFKAQYYKAVKQNENY